MIDELPSIYDENKWAVRPAGARQCSVPSFFGNAQQDHITDPLAHLGCAEGMKGRIRTKMRPGYIAGPESLSEPCDPSPTSHIPSGGDAMSTPAVLNAMSITAQMDAQAAAQALRYQQQAMLGGINEIHKVGGRNAS